jgi:hypothetical protein
MGDRRLFDLVTERLTIGRRMRILRHRTARWFAPPVRQPSIESAQALPRLRLLSPDPMPRRSPRATF